MNPLIQLNFHSFHVRVVILDGEPWWVGIDLCALLGIRDPHHALRQLEDYERGYTILSTPSGDQEMIVVNEGGLFRLMMKGRTATAKAFQRWVVTEVLPSIRKHGFYDPQRLAAMQAADAAGEFAKIAPSKAGRFLQEVKRYEIRSGKSALKLPGFSVNMLRQLELGGDVVKMLKRGSKWLLFLSAGFDLHYVIWGEDGGAYLADRRAELVKHFLAGDRPTTKALPS